MQSNEGEDTIPCVGRRPWDDWSEAGGKAEVDSEEDVGVEEEIEVGCEGGFEGGNDEELEIDVDEEILAEEEPEEEEEEIESRGGGVAKNAALDWGEKGPNFFISFWFWFLNKKPLQYPGYYI